MEKPVTAITENGIDNHDADSGDEFFSVNDFQETTETADHAKRSDTRASCGSAYFSAASSPVNPPQRIFVKRTYSLPKTDSRLSKAIKPDRQLWEIMKRSIAFTSFAKEPSSLFFPCDDQFQCLFNLGDNYLNNLLDPSAVTDAAQDFFYSPLPRYYIVVDNELLHQKKNLTRTILRYLNSQPTLSVAFSGAKSKDGLFHPRVISISSQLFTCLFDIRRLGMNFTKDNLGPILASEKITKWVLKWTDTAEKVAMNERFAVSLENFIELSSQEKRLDRMKGGLEDKHHSYNLWKLRRKYMNHDEVFNRIPEILFTAPIAWREVGAISQLGLRVKDQLVLQSALLAVICRLQAKEFMRPITKAVEKEMLKIFVWEERKTQDAWQQGGCWGDTTIPAANEASDDHCDPESHSDSEEETEAPFRG